MRKGKRVVALLSAAAMVMSMTACGGSGDNGDSSNESNAESKQGEAAEDTVVTINGYDYTKCADMTTDEITLTYFHFDQDETVQYLAKRFEEIYPNIKVNAVFEDVSTYMTTLGTMMNNQEYPDVIMYSDADTALKNGYLLDIKEYWEADDEVDSLASTVEGAGMGTFQTSGQLSVPVKFFPGAMYLDRNVFKTLNVDMPTQNWTWSEMIDLIKQCTVSGNSGEMSYYGLGYYNRLDSLYGIAASQDIIGEFGYDGKTFDLGVWATGEQEFADLKLGGYVAPSQNTDEMDAWSGDYYNWAGSTGHVAMFSEAFWTYQNLWGTEAYEQYDLDIVPYVIPAVSEEDASEAHHSIATIDFGGVCSGTEHPREAYELLKFMSFGKDGWMTRIELYNDETQTDSAGTALKHVSMPAPITTDEEVWNAYIDMYCSDMDDEHKQLWTNYFASCINPIPFGWTSIAGYFTYCVEYFNTIGIHDLVDAGTSKAADYAVEAEEKANYYHANAMISYFGPNSLYAGLLTDDEVAEYQAIVDAQGVVD